MKKNIFTLAIMILIPFILAGLISLIIPSYKEYYETLNKPLELPSIVFPIAWSIIYLLIGIASYIVLKNRGSGLELNIYYIQLFFNITWTLIFFGFRNLDVALVWTYILFTCVIVNTVVFYKVNKISGILFIPYILWVLFATYLTTSIWFLN